MVMVPEARSSRQDVRQAIDAQFWGQSASCVRSLDGTARVLSCEPPPMPQTAASGLSRAQQLLAYQAVAFPFLPGYSSSQDGLVFDRALKRAGGRNWWTVLLGRMRAQRIWKLHRTGERSVDALKHADNYGLATCSRVTFGRGTTLHMTLEAPDVGAALGDGKLLRLRGDPPLRGTAAVKQDVFDHEVLLTAAVNQEHVDSAASYSRIPLTSSLDVRSKDRSDGLQYRAGLHYVYAPETVCHVSGQQPFCDQADRGGPWKAALHAQGAVAVEGEAVLWRPPLPPARSSPLSFSGDGVEGIGAAAYDALDAANGMNGDGSLAIVPVSPVTTIGADSSEAASSDKSRQGGAAPHRRQVPRGRGMTFTRLSSGFGRPDESDWEDFDDEPLAVIKTSHGPITQRRLDEEYRMKPLRNRLPARESWRRFMAAFNAPDDGGSGPDNGVYKDSDDISSTSQPALELPEADAIQNGLVKATSTMQSLKQAAGVARREVRSGSLRRVLDTLSRQRGSGTRRPYSPWLAQPSAKVHGAIGCLARMPLPTSLGQLRSAAPPDHDGDGPGGPGGIEGALSSISSRLRGAWNPYLRQTSLRIFASAGASAQVGRFTRPVFDFTSVSVRLDAGMTSQHTGGGAADVGLGCEDRPHRAFALEGCNIWHAATLSVAQQVAGPVRMRADLRMSLHVPGGYSPEDGDRASLRSIYKAGVGLRPAPLEQVVGLDCVLPRTAGSGRAAIWWSPARREVMAELRLC